MITQGGRYAGINDKGGDGRYLVMGRRAAGLYKGSLFLLKIQHFDFFFLLWIWMGRDESSWVAVTKIQCPRLSQYIFS